MKFSIFFLLTLIPAIGLTHGEKKLQKKSIAHGHATPNGELYKKIILTFDDGPHPTNTNEVLKVLDLFSDELELAGKDRIKATFFINGSRLARYNYLFTPSGKYKYAYELLSVIEPMKKIVQNLTSSNYVLENQFIESAHTLANHSVSHSSLTDVFLNRSPTIVQDEIRLTHEVVSELMSNLSDCDQKWYFRAPYGGWRERNAGDANQENSIVRNYVGPIYWDIGNRVRYYPETNVPRDAADWECVKLKKSPEFCARGYLNNSYFKPDSMGGIVLMHDIQSVTYKMLPYMLRVWTGLNPYEKESAMHTKLESFVTKYKFDNVPTLEFSELDSMQALNKFDERFHPGGHCSK